LNDAHKYRDDAKVAVRIFRPILQALKVRSTDGHPPIFLALFDELAFLNLDMCSVQFAIGDIDAQGLFITKYTKQGLLRSYIIINRKLFNVSHSKSMKEIRKIAGVHEFVHFITIIYLATNYKTADLSSKLSPRLQRTIDKLWEPNLLDLYYTLSGKKTKSGFTPPELTDSHFRLGDEGKTPDYVVLFLHFMFSRELFEAYFDNTKQVQFKKYMMTGDTENAITLLIDTLKIAAADKDVPFTTAQDQLLEWVHVYTR